LPLTPRSCRQLHWHTNLAIRDFLRANPRVAARYIATALRAYSHAPASFMAELASAALAQDAD